MLAHSLAHGPLLDFQTGPLASLRSVLAGKTPMIYTGSLQGRLTLLLGLTLAFRPVGVLTTPTDHGYSRGHVAGTRGVLDPAGSRNVSFVPLLVYLGRENPLKQLLGSTSHPSYGQKFLS